MGDPEDYSIAREGGWGREGLAIAADHRPADDGKRVYEMDVVIQVRRTKRTEGGGPGEGEGARRCRLPEGWRIYLGGLFSLLDGLGSVLERSSVALGALLAFLVVLGAVLDRSWIRLGRSWVALGRLLGRFLLLLGRLQAVLGHLGAILVRLGVVSGRLGELKTLIFLVFFQRFLQNQGFE